MIRARRGGRRALSGSSYVRGRTAPGTVICPPLFGSIPAAMRNGCRRALGALGDVPQVGINPPFNATVEFWRPLVTSACVAAGINPDFALAWIDLESGGYPCSAGGLSNPEVGIFQLMGPDQAGTNIAAAGTSTALQHPVPPCKYSVASGQGDYTSPSALSSDQAYEQVRGGVAYIVTCMNAATSYLATYGYSWDQSSTDFWSTVKLCHVGVGYAANLLAQGVSDNGGVAPDTFDQLSSSAAAVGITAAVFAHTEAVGSFGGSSGPSQLLADLGAMGLVGLAVLGFGLWYLAFGDETA